MSTPNARTLAVVPSALAIACATSTAFAQADPAAPPKSPAAPPTQPAEPAPPPAQPAPAQEQPPVAAAESPWRIELNLWAWMVGMSGDVGAKGRTVHVDADFGDILEASDSVLAFSGRLELAYGPIGGFLDGMYSELGIDD